MVQDRNTLWQRRDTLHEVNLSHCMCVYIQQWPLCFCVSVCSKCAEVCDPREGITTAWPEGVANRCFVVCSPNRAHYIRGRL